jgi:hypothetical protein
MDADTPDKTVPFKTPAIQYTIKKLISKEKYCRATDFQHSGYAFLLVKAGSEYAFYS